MRKRYLLLIITVGAILIVSGLAHEPPAAAQTSATRVVYIGGAIFSPSSVTLTGNARLIVSVATGAEVPAIGVDNNTPIRAVVQIIENSNVGGISYSVSPARLEEVALTGGGVSSRLEFTFTMSSQNTNGGTLVYRALLVGLKNNGSLAQAGTPQSADATLTVAAAPTPTPTPTPAGGGCNQLQSWKCFRDGGNPDPATCECVFNESPILIDTEGDGFELTDIEHGVEFDLDGDGLLAERVSWTAPDSDDAFLFLDRNEDRVVNNATELFGNVTAQPYAPVPNGFVALSMYDTAIHGGNGDGVIDGRDAVFSQLRLWRDANHDGRSGPGELYALSELKVESISLDYKESGRRDRHGNRFRYRSKVGGRDPGRWAYDVFLLSSQHP
jgi:hypothetical protein